MTQSDGAMGGAPLLESRQHGPVGELSALTRPGSGAPVVILHGVLADAYAWKAVARAVAPERPAIVPNRRGRQPSGPMSDRYSVDVEVKDLLHWLWLQDQPVDLVGHSYGGLIALEAVRRGAEVRSLVLYDPVGPPFGRGALPALMGALDGGDLDAAVEIISIDLSGYSQEHVAALRAHPAWERLRELAVPAAQELAAIENFRFDPDAYASLDVPTTLIAGELSRHRPPYGPSVDRFREALAVPEVKLLEGHDHLAHVTGPRQLAQVINESLRAG